MTEPSHPQASSTITEPRADDPSSPGPLADEAPVTESGAGGKALPSRTPWESAAGRQPSFVFFGAVAAVTLLLDVATKAWAQLVLSQRTVTDPGIVVIDPYLAFTLAYNRGGAWGVFQDASDTIRRPFFLLVSVAAFVFIVSLYNRLQPSQRALTWGLPLVLGGALGNLIDRIVRHSVIDFIDYRAAWVGKMNQLIADTVSSGWHVTEHWPTFNVADVAISAGVVLMAIDMVFSRREGASTASAGQVASGGQTSVETTAEPPSTPVVGTNRSAPPAAAP